MANFVTPRKTDELYGGEILSQGMISCSFNELFSVKGVFSIKQTGSLYSIQLGC